MAPDFLTVPPVDLRQLLYFVAVAGELNFTRAAERLHISAPALSQQVKALERHLGVQLLVRDTRHVRLTPAGEVLAQSARRLLDDGDSAVRQARTIAGVIDGQLRLAALHEAEGAFEAFLTEFHTAYRGIEFTISAMRHNELIAALRNRTADAALTWSWLLERAGGSDGLHSMTVTRTEVFAALHPHSALARAERVTRGEALRDYGVVLFERDYSTVTFDYALEQLYGADCTDPPVQEIGVTVRAQEAIARHITPTAFAPLSRPLAEMMRGTWEIRPFAPPWLMDGCVVWERDNSSAALIAFMAAAALVGGHAATAGDGEVPRVVD
jgi:DNA-binding transcriptional LysR family regulator